MENEENDIIRQLADKLRDSELPYKEGAWERFTAMEANVSAVTDTGEPAKRTGAGIRAVLRPWIGIAAALVLAAGAGWYYLAGHKNMPPAGANRPEGQLTSAIPAQPGPQSQGITNNDNGEAKTGDGQNRTYIDQRGESRRNAPIQTGSLQRLASVSRPDMHSPTERPLIENTGIIPLIHPFGQGNRGAAARIAEDALMSTAPNSGRYGAGLSISPAAPATQVDEQRIVTADVHSDKSGKSAAMNSSEAHFDDKGYFNLDDDRSSRRWNMGVVVIPAVSNAAKLNMGYGLSVGYRLSNRLSINSGVAYTQLSGSKDAGGTPIIGASGRMLSSIDATAAGLNVPLELRYHISQKIYVGTGVSGMALLSDKVERRYAIAEMQTTAFEARNGQALKPDAMQSIASDIRTKEILPEDQIGSKDFAGFINFSFGFKQPLNKSKSLSIEPFISIPMSNHLFNQNIRMTDGGLRIKLGL